jgi:hypothetical protein
MYSYYDIKSRAKFIDQAKCHNQIQVVILLDGDKIVHIGHTEKLQSLFEEAGNEVFFDRVFSTKTESKSDAELLVYDYKIKFGLSLVGDVKSLVTITEPLGEESNQSLVTEIEPKPVEKDAISIKNDFSAETKGLISLPEKVQDYSGRRVKQPYVWTKEALAKSAEIVKRALANTARLNELRAKGLHPL